MEPELYSMGGHQAIDEHLGTVTGQMASQQETLHQLMKTQSKMEQQQSEALSRDRAAVQERLDAMDQRFKQQDQAMRALRQQQDHILRLLSIQGRLADQDRQMRAFMASQEALIRNFQPPIMEQHAQLQQLQANQAHLIQALGSLNLSQGSSAGLSHVPAGLTVMGQFPAEFSHQPFQQPLAHQPPQQRGQALMQYSEPPVKGGIRPWPNHDPSHDAKVLRKAMKGLGTDERKIIDILSTRTNAQRVAVASAFQQNYKRDLIADLKSETSGNFRLLLEALCLPPRAFDALSVRKAVKGLGTDDSVLIEVLCSRTNREINELKAAYSELQGRDLITDIRGDTSGDYQKLLLALAQGTRDESYMVDLNQVKADASALYQAGEARAGTDEQVFIDIFSQRNFAHLRATFDHYSKARSFGASQSVSWREGIG